jgi:hypothetical protein
MEQIELDLSELKLIYQLENMVLLIILLFVDGLNTMKNGNGC